MPLVLVRSFHDGQKLSKLWGKTLSELTKLPTTISYRPEMRAWKMFRASDLEITDLANLRMYRDCMRALAAIEPFDAAFCMEVDESRKRLRLARRDQACIYYEGRRLVTIEEDAEGMPADCIDEWPGLERTEQARDWTAMQWFLFFHGQVVEELDASIDGMKSLSDISAHISLTRRNMNAEERRIARR